MNTKLLKQKILDLAIRGKLVPQDPNDEPASELHKRIRAEKEKLIAEGKIKRSKKTGDKPHYENMPFEIPSNWEWVRIGDVFSMQAGKNISAIDISSEKVGNSIYPCYGGNGLRGYVKTFNNDGAFPIIGRQGALCGNVNIVEGKFYATEHAVVTNCYNVSDVHWAFYFLIALNLNQYATATAQPGLAVSNILSVLMPLPPYCEQIRIVSAIEHMFALIDSIENEGQRLQKAINLAKSKILDLAIHGKLVSQDPNDEPASELLKRIAPYRIPCDTSHYGNLPKGWCSATIKQLCDVMGGLWTGKKPPYVNVGVIRNTNFSKDFKLDLTNVAYLDVERHQYEKRKLQYGDLILEKSGGSDKQPVGRVILYDNEEGDFSYSNFTSRLRIKAPSVIIPQFLFYALLYAYLNGETQSMQKQTTGIHNLIMDKYLSVSVPVPPINEQNRIVQKIQKIEGKIREISAEL